MEATKEMITLPTTPVPPSRQNPRTLLLYGAPKVGKTTLLSQLDNTLIIDLEKGSDYISAMKVQANTIEEFIQILDSLRQPNAPKYKRIAIDTVTRLEDWCEETATRVYKASAVGKSFEGKSVLALPNGGGYLWLRMEFKKYFTMVKQCCEEVIFVAHLRDKLLSSEDKVLQPDGTFKLVKSDEVSHKDVDLTGKCRSIACTDADAIGRLYRDRTGELYISFQGNDTTICGSRCEHIKGKNIKFDWSKIYI